MMPASKEPVGLSGFSRGLYTAGQQQKQQHRERQAVVVVVGECTRQTTGNRSVMCESLWKQEVGPRAGQSWEHKTQSYDLRNRFVISDNYFTEQLATSWWVGHSLCMV